MASRKIYMKYKVIVHSLGLKQVDVYRVRDDNVTKDIVRVVDPLSNKVAVVDLGTVREALSFTEFLERLLEGLKKAGVQVSERRVAAAREKARAMDEALAARASQ